MFLFVSNKPQKFNIKSSLRQPVEGKVQLVLAVQLKCRFRQKVSPSLNGVPLFGVILNLKTSGSCLF